VHIRDPALQAFQHCGDCWSCDASSGTEGLPYEIVFGLVYLNYFLLSYMPVMACGFFYPLARWQAA
jgi:hypothetical protein